MNNNDKTSEIIRLLSSIDTSVKSGVLALVAVAIQIRSGDKNDITNERQLENAAELLRLSTKALAPSF
jgi:hypothetical protein